VKRGLIAGGLSLLIFFSTLTLQIQGPESTAPSVPRGDAWHAFEWWYAQRAAPNSHIPPGALRRAYQSKKTLAALKGSGKIVRGETSGRGNLASSLSQWESIGPSNIGGRVLSIAVHPVNTSTVFAGSASGGLWKTTTGGTGAGAWSFIDTGFPVLSVSALAIDPLHPDTMYLGTGEISRYVRPLIGVVGARSSYGLGILRSTDGGSTWDTTGLSWSFAAVTAIQKIIINPLNTSTIFAATSEGVYKSTDAGGSWTLSNPVLMAMDVVISSSDTTILISSHGNLNSSPNPGLYMSFDAGGSWSKIDGGLPASNFGRTALAISPSNPSYVYAGISNGATSTAIGLYRSTNGGGNWNLMTTTNYVGSQGWYNNALAVHPTDPFTIYAAGFDAHKSADGGATLPAVSSGIVHVDHHAIAFDPSDPNIVYLGTDGGMFRTTDGGTTFKDLNNGFVTTQFYPGFASARDDSTIALGGLQDNGTLRYSGSQAWLAVLGGDGGWCAIDPTNSSTMYAESQYGRIARSFGGGFSPATSGLPGNQSEWNFIPPFVVAPSNPNVLYAGARNVYKTTNQGSSWAPADGNPTLNGTTISCIAVSRTSEDTLLAGTGTGSFGATPLFEVFSSTDGGGHWVNVTGSLPDRYPTDLEFDPRDSRVAYVTYSGYGTPHLFRTSDLGATWTDISSSLPDMPHQCIAVDPVYSNYLYAGNDLGVYRSDDTGQTWTEYGEGMPEAMILDLVVSESNDALRAATFGNGIYQRHLPRFSALSLTHPSGNEILISGFVETIRWDESYTSKVDIAFSSDGGATWASVADTVPAALEEFDWTVPPISTTQGLIRVNNSDGGSPADSNGIPFSILVNPDLLAGWNMVSVPLSVGNFLKDSVFPTSTSKAFAYQTGYVVRDTLSNGRGFWLKFDGPQFTNMTGDSIFTDSINVQAGWNIIGSISRPVPLSGIVEEPPGLISSSVFGYRRGYAETDTLFPGRGYWVKTVSGGKIHLSSAIAVPGTSIQPLSADDELNRLTIADAAGFEQTLYFTSGASVHRLGAADLPPPAPGRSGDARFSSNRMLETFSPGSGTGTGMEIRTSNLSAPVKLSWRIADESHGYTLQTAGGSQVSITGTGEIVLMTPPGKLSLRASSGGTAGLPGQFNLGRNYPNPFNPVTTIPFSLPSDSPVRLTVYDIGGREVENLMEGPLTAGEHAVRWDASGYASGLYFYRLTVPGRSVTSKMILLK
jgi:photosystem II stability/assembly factor-like uncharacterized protein